MFEWKDESYIQLFTAIFLTLSAFSGGYSAANVDFTGDRMSDVQAIGQMDGVRTFDIFANKAQDDVQPMMEKALENPTSRNLMKANNHLYIGVQNWADRHEGENKELFQEYLNACELVIDEKQAGHNIEAEIKEMNRLYNKLQNS